MEARTVQEKFVHDFVAAWSKVMNLDRFDLRLPSAHKVETGSPSPQNSLLNRQRPQSLGCGRFLFQSHRGALSCWPPRNLLSERGGKHESPPLDPLRRHRLHRRLRHRVPQRSHSLPLFSWPIRSRKGPAQLAPLARHRHLRRGIHSRRLALRAHCSLQTRSASPCTLRGRRRSSGSASPSACGEPGRTGIPSSGSRSGPSVSGLAALAAPKPESAAPSPAEPRLHRFKIAVWTSS